MKIKKKSPTKDVTVKDLKPNPSNPRHITDEKKTMLKRSLEQFGDLSGIIFNRSTKQLIGGHQRREVMPDDSKIVIEQTYSKPTSTGTIAEGYVLINGERHKYREVYVDKITEKAMNVAANKHGGDFDIPKLSEWLLELDALNYDMGLTGFTKEEIENIMAPVTKLAAQGDPDHIPSAPKIATTKPGDVYQLGVHRLMCGDSSVITSVDRLMNGETAVLMVTDPPYGIKLDQSWRDEALGSKALGKGNKNLVSNDDRADWYDVWSIAPVTIAYVWHASSFTDVVMDSLRRANFEVRQQIIWNKSVMVMGRSAYHFKHEPCWYAVKKGSDANWVGDRKQTTVWDAAPPNHIMGGSKEEKTEHPTQKPILIYEIPIQNHTTLGDCIYEPFGGSGTGMIACEKMSRKCFMMELDPIYCDVIVKRWEQFTGKKAILLS